MADLGYGGFWRWRPLAMAERNLTKFGLVPLRTSDHAVTFVALGLFREKNPHSFVACHRF